MAYVPEQMGAYDPAEGMGFKLKIKMPKITIKKPLQSVANVVKAVVRPVEVVARATTAVAAQSIGLKNLASDIGGNTISKDVLKTAGTVVQVAGAAVGAVVAAPAIAAGASAVAGGVASAASAVAGVVASGASAVYSAVGGGALVKKLAPQVLASLMKGQKAPAYSELPAEEQAGMTQAEYDALVKEQEAIALKQSEEAAKLPPPEVPVNNSTVVTPPSVGGQVMTKPARERKPRPSTMKPMTPDTGAVAPTYSIPRESAQQEQGPANPFLFYTEAQLAAEKQAVEQAILYRQSKGLSADGDYRDMTLVQLYAKKALIMAAYTPILIKKYGLYAAGGLALILAVSMGRRKK